MAQSYFGFYSDTAKTEVIFEGTNVLTKSSRKDYLDGDDYRLADGTLVTWEKVAKYEEKLTCYLVSETDRNTLKDEYDEHEAFYYYPDVINRSTEYYQVKWTGRYIETFDKKTKRYTITIELKEI